MELESIAAVLESSFPDMVRVQSYDGTSLVLAFLFECGPREDHAYVVSFERAILFHVPAFFHEEVRLRKASEAERERLIPERSYDPFEVSGEDGAYTVVLLTNPDGKAFGYYIAAESVSAGWVTLESLSVSL